MPKRRWWQRRPSFFDRFTNLTHTENRLAVYNDVPGRTQAEIVALYDRAIALCWADSEEKRRGATLPVLVAAFLALSLPALAQDRFSCGGPGACDIIVNMDPSGADFSYGIKLEATIDKGKPPYLRKAMRATNFVKTYMPLLKEPKSIMIEMDGEKALAPWHALIEVGEAKFCLIAYNDICIIKGNRVDIR